MYDIQFLHALVLIVKLVIYSLFMLYNWHKYHVTSSLYYNGNLVVKGVYNPLF